MNLSAVILAGGKSNRMGRDKARLILDGESLLSHQLRKVRMLNPAEVLISGRSCEDYSTFNCPVVFDLEPGFGPLGGIERALHAATSPLLLVLAVDLPRMTTEFLRNLFARCDRLTGVVPKLNGGLEPLAAAGADRLAGRVPVPRLPRPRASHGRAPRLRSADRFRVRVPDAR